MQSIAYAYGDTGLRDNVEYGGKAYVDSVNAKLLDPDWERDTDATAGGLILLPGVNGYSYDAIGNRKADSR